MNKEKLLKAVDDLKNEYDAFYMMNRCSWEKDENTHAEEFEMLSNIQGDKVQNALAWIHDCYDCYYKDELGEDNAFAYLKMVIKDE
ncbi:hypothetical protein [Candidatus Stoquefichus sp. SB1]|uniref:hypothetical protein n=1 Tax=Candidatus Stoquefichus sp. SB1 TaxID=1658109 RepID=UPI00067EEAEB|nr:hypothetical protein [Candidatus Stoquefichus sp. SB1]